MHYSKDRYNPAQCAHDTKGFKGIEDRSKSPAAKTRPRSRNINRNGDHLI